MTTNKYHGCIQLKSTDQIFWVDFDVPPSELGQERFFEVEYFDKSANKLKHRLMAIDDIAIFEFWEV